MTPTARHYTRLHSAARRRELQRAARHYGIAALITVVIAAGFIAVAGDFTERAAADRVAAEVAGGW